MDLPIDSMVMFHRFLYVYQAGYNTSYCTTGVFFVFEVPWEAMSEKDSSKVDIDQLTTHHFFGSIW